MSPGEGQEARQGDGKDRGRRQQPKLLIGEEPEDADRDAGQ